jgi:hypothetical protein
MGREPRRWDWVRLDRIGLWGTVASHPSLIINVASILRTPRPTTTHPHAGGPPQAGGAAGGAAPSTVFECDDGGIRG